MDAALQQFVRERARFRCEYCLLPEALVSTPFQFDHISTPDGRDAGEFDWPVFAQEEEKMKRKKLARLINLAESLNYQLTPKP